MVKEPEFKDKGDLCAWALVNCTSRIVYYVRLNGIRHKIHVSKGNRFRQPHVYCEKVEDKIAE